ncbi:hypothetical protein GcC1_187001 [Golovinomyces cichoracearum]|uniref:Mis18 domain-containing protein n=1 Tax=Golovinomyces cichoracearum TaxID=62708 RepID=A0A420HJX7_9PEZI|nr:hypothetical protein GcC1_187001 [Golovinomyces cichoracearum]
MEVVICYCLNCKSELGRFRNAWNGIGNTYFSPIYNLVTSTGLETTGDVYEAAQGSSIQFSLLRDVVCTRCGVVLGLRCDTAPENHLLKQDQLILRLKEMFIVSERSGKSVNASVLKTISLKEEGNTDTTTLPRVAPVHLFSHPLNPSTDSNDREYDETGDDVLEKIQAHKLSQTKQSPQFVTVKELKSLTVEVENFKTWTRDLISNQQKDIERLSRTISGIEREMQSVKNLLQEIKTQSKTCYPGKEFAKELVDTRDVIKKVSGKLDQKEDAPDWTKTAGLLARNLKIVASDVKNLSVKAEEVSGLKLNLEELAGRLHFIEVEHKDLACPKFPASVNEVSLSRKRTHDLVENNGRNQEPNSSQVQLKIKNEFLGELRTRDDQRTEIINLVLPEPNSQVHGKSHDKSTVQGHIPPRKKDFTHRTPQVLIRGSNIKKSLNEVSKKPDSSKLGEKKVDLAEHRSMTRTEYTRKDKQRRRSESTLQGSMKKVYTITQKNKTENLEILGTNQFEKIRI